MRVEALALQVGVLARQVRRFVTELREDGVAICGTPTHGYYIAGTPEELEEDFASSSVVARCTASPRIPPAQGAAAGSDRGSRYLRT